MERDYYAEFVKEHIDASDPAARTKFCALWAAFMAHTPASFGRTARQREFERALSDAGFVLGRLVDTRYVGGAWLKDVPKPQKRWVATENGRMRLALDRSRGAAEAASVGQ